MREILLFLCLIPTYVLGQADFSLNQGTMSTNEYFEELPFEFLQGQIIIKVSINGSHYRFSLDTGAPTSISDSLYKKINSETISKIKITDANSNTDSVIVITLKSIRLGDISINNTSALVLNSNNLIFKCFDLDGNLGSNSLRNSVVQFDLPNKMIRITNKAKNFDLKRKNSQKLKLTLYQSSPFFWVKLIGKDKGILQLLFDSGMEGLLDLSLRNYLLFKKHEIFKNTRTAVGNNIIGLLGTTTDTLHYNLQVEKLKFGKIELKNTIIKTTKAQNSRVGTKLLEFAVVTLDYKKERIYFTPIGENEQDAYNPTFPIQPNYKDGKFQIGFIWKPEQVPNITLGDEILFVNGISCREKSICELLLLMDGIDNRKIEIVTENQEGKQFTSTIVKE